MQRIDELNKRLKVIQDNILKLNASATLVAVSKDTTIDDIKRLYELGHRDFGENRVEQLAKRSQLLSSYSINWHMIGHVQSNKLNKLLQVNKLKYIHSIDSEKLVNSIIKSDIQFFLQVNTSQEKEKFGFVQITELEKLIYHKNVIGLMAMGKIRTNQFDQDAEASFKKLNQIKVALNHNLKTSMGMSEDYKIALHYKSDFIRVGSNLFKQQDH